MAGQIVTMAQFKASLDPSGFKQGVEEIKRASKEAETAVGKVGVATQKAGKDAAVSSEGFQKWFATVDQNVAAAQRYQRELEKLERFQKSGVVSAGEYSAAQDAIRRKYADLIGAQDTATAGLGKYSGALNFARTALGAFGISLGVGAVVQWGKSVIDAAGNLQDMSDALNVSAGFIRAWEASALDAGVASQKADTALERLNDKFGDAVRGVPEAVKWFKALGIEVDDLAARGAKLDEVAGLVNAGIASMPSGFAQASAAQDAYGKGMAKMLPLIREGAEGIERLSKAAKDSGSDENIRAIDRFGDTAAARMRELRDGAMSALGAAIRLHDFLTGRTALDNAKAAAGQLSAYQNMPFAGADSLGTAFPAYDPLRGQIQGVNITGGAFDDDRTQQAQRNAEAAKRAQEVIRQAEMDTLKQRLDAEKKVEAAKYDGFQKEQALRDDNLKEIMKWADDAADANTRLFDKMEADAQQAFDRMSGFARSFIDSLLSGRGLDFAKQFGLNSLSDQLTSSAMSLLGPQNAALVSQYAGPAAAVAYGGYQLGSAGASALGGSQTVGGIAGALFGGIPGALISTLFKGVDKPSNYTAFANFGDDFSLVGGVSGDKPNADTLSAARTIGDAVSRAAQMLEAAGVDLQGISRILIGQRDPSYLVTASGERVQVGASGDVQGAISGSFDYLLGGASSANPELQALLDSYRGAGKLNSFNIDALLGEASATAAKPAQLDALNKALQTLFDQITNPDLAAYNAMLAEQNARMEAAQKIGADLNLVMAINNAETEQYNQKIAERAQREAAAVAAEAARAEAERIREEERAAAEAARAEAERVREAERVAAEAAAAAKRLSAFGSDISIGILGYTDPLGAQLAVEQRAADERLATARELGGDLVQVERLNGLARERILSDAAARERQTLVSAATDVLSQALSSVSQQANQQRGIADAYFGAAGRLGDARSGLLLSDLAPSSPTSRYAEARRQLEALQQGAFGGNLDAIGGLPSAAEQFLRASREVNASTGAYGADFAFVQSALETAQGASGAFGNRALSSAESAERTFGVLVQIRDVLDTESPDGAILRAQLGVLQSMEIRFGALEESMAKLADETAQMRRDQMTA
jgi:hypothetical protein